MEYVFGHTICNGVDMDNLKTIGESHSDLEGSLSVSREYSDSIITDSFKIVEKYRSNVDAEGKCYDWYVIADHYRYIDRYTPASKEIEKNFNVVNETLDAVLTETIPNQDETIRNLADTVEDILINVIPNI